MPAPEPLILTLQMDDAAFERFDALRRRHFPAALNRIPAHATLFHHLPGDEEDAVTDAVAREAAAERAPEIRVTGLRSTGRGVAFVLESPALSAFRARLAARFEPRLTPQDRQGWRPHVTVQNKVAPADARSLQAELEAGFAPFGFTAPGVLLWRYRGGPWEPLAALLFGRNA